MEEREGKRVVDVKSGGGGIVSYVDAIFLLIDGASGISHFTLVSVSTLSSS